MLPNALYSKETFNLTKYKDVLYHTCKQCNESFPLTKRDVCNVLRGYGKGEFCSQKCRMESKSKKIKTTCGTCGKSIVVPSWPLLRSKHKLGFCSQSCAGKYTTTHRKHGYKRSKLEIWLEQQLTILYPTLDIRFNCKDTVNSELDIYIPSLQLAFELNGIFHYEPIYGAEKLRLIQSNDSRKFQACLEHGIELCIIDTSGQKYFKEKSSQQFLDIIVQVLSVKAERLRSEHTT